jgi:hypothetical protein
MTSRKIAATLLVALPLVLAARNAMAEQTYISTKWVETQLSMDECLGRAAASIRGAGGWGKVLDTPDARHAFRGLYTAQVRCIPDMKMVIFVVAGPSNTSGKYVDEIADHF